MPELFLSEIRALNTTHTPVGTDLFFIQKQDGSSDAYSLTELAAFISSTQLTESVVLTTTATLAQSVPQLNATGAYLTWGVISADAGNLISLASGNEVLIHDKVKALNLSCTVKSKGGACTLSIVKNGNLANPVAQNAATLADGGTISVSVNAHEVKSGDYLQIHLQTSSQVYTDTTSLTVTVTEVYL